MDAYSQATSASLKKFIEDAASFNRDKTIILDLRGNHGGNSEYGDKWLKNLIGYIPSLTSKPSLLWASNANVNYFSQLFQHDYEKMSATEKADLRKWQSCVETSRGKLAACESDESDQHVHRKVSPKNNYHVA
jgi:hypothetical protein